MNLLFILLSFLISLSVSAYCIPKIIVIAHRKRLFDNTEYRKIHRTVTPRLGGISFIISIILAASITIGFIIRTGQTISESIPLLAGLCSLVVLSFVGIADDLIGLKYKAKFSAQFIAALLTVSSGIYINNLHGLFSVQQIPEWIAVPFTVIFIVYVINSINLIDGVDGLASGICGLAFIVLGVLFWQQQQIVYAVVSLASIGMLIPFFHYNVFAKDRLKIFMGDSGSLTIGYILVFLLVQLLRGQYQQGTEDSHRIVIMAVSLVLIPVLDGIRVMVYRFRKHIHIFQPDNNHIHHKFLAAGFSPRSTMALLLITVFALTIINFALTEKVNINVILLLDILLYAALSFYLSKKQLKNEGDKI